MEALSAVFFAANDLDASKILFIRTGVPVSRLMGTCVPLYEMTGSHEEQAHINMACRNFN